MKIYRYKNNTKGDGTFSTQHFIIENGIVYKLDATDNYIVGSYDVDLNELELI